MKVRWGGRLQFAGCSAILVMIVVLAPRSAPAEEKEAGKPVPNPHGDPTQCHVCHGLTVEGQGFAPFRSDVLSLCRSCHDGRHAAREAHPVGMIPTGAIAKKMPAEFPLEGGRLGCLTCHDVASACITTAPMSLRGGPVASSIRFCFRCHAEEVYRPFNVHDQLEGDQLKTDTCLWCHTAVPDVRSEAEPLSTLRRRSSGVCRSCHMVPKDHPAGGSHMGATPPPEMVWRMSAYEMQLTMRLPFAELLKYARSAKRPPRSMPFDEEGGITCYTCHNPHERGLWPSRDLRAIGAEPKQATNHRLRAHQGRMCVACHEK